MANQLSLDTVLDLLSRPLRRALLVCLYQSDAPLAVADVSKEIIWRTSSTARDDVTFDEVEDCHLSLRHRDIPKLAEYGVVTMDVEDNTVALTERGRRLVREQEDLVYQNLR